jgi:hypothetical protein
VLDVDKDVRSSILEQLEKDMLVGIEEVKEKFKAKAETIKADLEKNLADAEEKYKEKDSKELKKEALQLKAKNQLASLQERH